MNITLAAVLMAQSAAGAEKPLSTHGSAGTLGGTFHAIDGRDQHPPVVLVIPGSGPTDRDGNSPLGIRAAPYRMLASALGADGISTVRIDKRGMYGSANPGVDANDVTIEAYAEDVHAWVRQLRKTTGNPCVWVLGHSEGALVAEVAAGRGDGICGLILVSAAGRKAADILTAQLRANPANAPVLVQALAAISKLRDGQRVDASTLATPLQTLFRPAVQGYLINWFSFDPVVELKRFTGPVLVIQGTDDLQTSMDDAHRLASARPGIEMRPIVGMNHVWKLPGESVAANFASYSDPSLPLAPELAKTIADFIRRHEKK